MKSLKFLLVGTALCVSFASYSQTDTTKKDTTTRKTDTTQKKTPGINESSSISNQDQPAVSQSAATSATTNQSTTPAATSGETSSAPKPNFGRYYIPVLGSYNATASTTENKSITVTGDESNPGKIWIEGLTGTKIYALLKAAPGTYKIPAQKQDDKSIAEGTVVYDEGSKQINLCVGCGYNDQTPAIAEADASATTETETAKDKKNHQASKMKKAPVVSFTGTKADQGTVSILQ